jgi:hypothetical protein
LHNYLARTVSVPPTGNRQDGYSQSIELIYLQIYMRKMRKNDSEDGSMHTIANIPKMPSMPPRLCHSWPWQLQEQDQGRYYLQEVLNDVVPAGGI